MKRLCYFHVGKIEHDCLVFVVVGRPVIFGDPRIEYNLTTFLYFILHIQIKVVPLYRNAW